MLRRPPYLVGLVLALVTALGSPAPAPAQITFTYNYINPTGSTFYTADRRAAIERAGDYIRTQIDARGTVSLTFDTQGMGPAPPAPLAFGGTLYFVQNGGFTNGILYTQATTNSLGGQPEHGGVTFNSSLANWYTGTSPSVPGTQFDMQSVAVHELTHALGFASLINFNNPPRPDGSGLQGLPPGQPDTFGRFDSLLRVGTAPDAPLLVNPNGTFNTSQLGVLGSNTPIYFHGEMAVAANGGPVRLAGGSDADLSHLDDSVSATAVMLSAIPNGTARRAFQAVELAMLIDLGWNQYAWTGSVSGDWAANVSSTAGSRWRNIEGANSLSPVGTITPNLVLRFGGDGGYTSTNGLDLSATGGRFLVNRIILNGTTGTSTIQSNGTNVLRFDTTIGVTPLIRQDGAGAFVLSHPVELTNSNLQLGGVGTGRVTLSGPISVQAGHTGGLTKLGGSTFVLAGANTYNGPTTVTAGTLLVNGQTGAESGTGTGAVTVNGGTLGGTGRVGGPVTVNAAATLAPGDSGVGTLTVAGNTVFNSGGRFGVEAGAPGNADRLVVQGPTTTLDFRAGSVLRLTLLGGFTNAAATSYTLASLPAGAGNNLRNNGAATIDGAILGTYVQGVGPAGTVTIDPTGFALTAGDAFILRRSGDDVVLLFSPVPEPATVLGLAAVGWGVATLVRRRRGRAADPAGKA
jgi:autotransporter-associated beta strand protein